MAEAPKDTHYYIIVSKPHKIIERKRVIFPPWRRCSELAESVPGKREEVAAESPEAAMEKAGLKKEWVKSISRPRENSLVIYPDRTWDFAYVPDSAMPDDANLFTSFIETGFFAAPRPVYVLKQRVKKGTGEVFYEAHARPGKITKPPDLFYMFLFWWETNILFKARGPNLAKINQGLMIALGIILVVFTWLAVS